MRCSLETSQKEPTCLFGPRYCQEFLSQKWRDELGQVLQALETEI